MLLRVLALLAGGSSQSCPCRTGGGADSGSRAGRGCWRRPTPGGGRRGSSGCAPLGALRLLCRGGCRAPSRPHLPRSTRGGTLGV